MSRPTQTQKRTPRKQPLPEPPKKDWRQYATLVTAGAAGVAAVLYLWANIAQPIVSSGPLPIPARSEVVAVAKSVEDLKTESIDVDNQIINRLEDLGESLERFEAQQQEQLADTRTNRLRNLQLAIDAARGKYAQSRSVDDQRILETLEMQMDSLQRQITETTK